MAIICWSICACPALTILPLQGPREQSRPVSLEVGNAMKQAPGDGEGRGGLMCCSPWGCKELGTTERLNNNNATEEKNNSEAECSGSSQASRVNSGVTPSLYQTPDPPYVLGRPESTISFGDGKLRPRQRSRRRTGLVCEPRSSDTQASALSSSDLCCHLTCPPQGLHVSLCIKRVS